MSLSRSSVVLLILSLAGGGGALAQDGASDTEEGRAETKEKVEKIVEKEVEKEVEAENEQDSEAVGADPGEASYNVANCASSEEGGSGSEQSAEAGNPDAIEECKDMVK